MENMLNTPDFSYIRLPTYGYTYNTNFVRMQMVHMRLEVS